MVYPALSSSLQLQGRQLKTTISIYTCGETKYALISFLCWHGRVIISHVFFCVCWEASVTTTVWFRTWQNSHKCQRRCQAILSHYLMRESRYVRQWRKRQALTRRQSHWFGYPTAERSQRNILHWDFPVMKFTSAVSGRQPGGVIGDMTLHAHAALKITTFLNKYAVLIYVWNDRKVMSD